MHNILANTTTMPYAIGGAVGAIAVVFSAWRWLTSLWRHDIDERVCRLEGGEVFVKRHLERQNTKLDTIQQKIEVIHGDIGYIKGQMNGQGQSSIE